MKEEIIINAENRPIGRLATEIAKYLQGKHRPDYQPNIDLPIYVLVENIDKAKFTGKKLANEVFIKHTGYLGHRKEILWKTLWEKDKLEFIKRVVKNMLPKNKLQKRRLLRIKII
ncbi:MAG: 50S ribosomal protein L13 [Candidatus Parcubacteria bacterium]|nr:MAG: 50S ribosomal protein L13 [Candidatus Parcubacteria bacterium]